MPEDDRFELILEIRRLQLPTKIMGVTGKTQSGFSVEHIRDILRTFDIDGFLMKPFPDEELLSAVELAVRA